MKRFLPFIPLAIAAGIGLAVWWGLTSDRDPNAIPSVLIDQAVPEFTLPPIEATGTPSLQTSDLTAASEPILVNLFASWCLPCRAEHAVLIRLTKEEDVLLAGINYKDKPESAAKWLAELGNPYWRIGSDISGRAGIEWGVSGVPETFVIGPEGKIRYRHVGAISSEADIDKVRRALAAARDINR